MLAISTNPGSRQPKVASVAASGEPAGITFGHYVLEKEIAHGGMGVVYRARQKGLERTVAVKLLLLGRHASNESVDRFRREARSAAALRHPNIVAIYEVGECEGQQFFSMEFVDGPNLAIVLRAGLPRVRTAAEFARTIAETIHFAHQQGVLHRDLKPSNILIDASGTLRITDFGLAKRLDGSGDLTESGRVLGSPNYLAPEAASGQITAAGPASDIYSVGAMLYEFLTGRPPFLASSVPETLVRIRDSEPISPRVLNPGIPKDLETICLKCLEKEPSNRYATARELADDLGRWLGHRPILARPTGKVERVFKWGRRQPRLAAMGAATLFAVLATVIVLLVANFQTREAQRLAAQKAEESRQRLIQLSVLAGNRLAEDGDGHGALLWFAEALRLDSGNSEREDVHRRRFSAALRAAPVLTQFWQASEPFQDADFTADERHLLLRNDEGSIQVWDTESGRPFSPVLTNGGVISMACLTDDGRRIVTCALDGALQFWNTHTGELVVQSDLTLAPGWSAVEPSADRRWLLARTTNGLQRLDASNGRAAGALIPISEGVRELSLNFDGNRVSVISTNNTVRFLDLQTGWAYAPDIHPDQRADRSNLSLDGERFLSALGFPSRGVASWDVKTGHRLSKVEPGGDIFDCRFSPDGRRFATASWDGSARVYDTLTGLPVCDAMRHLRGVARLTYSSDGRRLATASWDSTARIWDPETGRPLSPMLWHAGYVLHTWFSPKSRFLLTSSVDHTARLWKLAPPSPARLILRHRGQVCRARFSPEGARILTCGGDGEVRIWSRTNGELLMHLNVGSHAGDAVFDSSGERVAVAVQSGRVIVWNLGQPSSIMTNIIHSGPVIAVEFSPDGTRLVTASADHTARIWSAETGAPLSPWLRHTGFVAAAAFSPDGRRVATASYDRTAQIWDADTGARFGPFLPHAAPVVAVSFNSDGSQVITASADEGYPVRAAQVWDVASGQRVGPPLWHQDGVVCAVFSPNNRWLASGGEDGYAKVWDARSGRAVTGLMRHGSYVLSVNFSPDSRLLLTVSSDHTARVWNAEDGEPVTPRLLHDAAVEFGAWSPDGNEVVTASSDGTARVWDISPSTEPPEALREQAELFSAHRLAGNNTIVPLTALEMKRLWEKSHRNPP